MLSLTKSRNAGKRLIFLLVLFFALCLFYTSNAQELVVITLDQEDGLFAIPSEIVLNPGDSLQFVSVNGDFGILITDAVKFLKIKDANLKIRVNSSTDPDSDIYVVREIKEFETDYSIFCISNNGWPLAPPRIIIVSQ